MHRISLYIIILCLLIGCAGSDKEFPLGGNAGAKIITPTSSTEYLTLAVEDLSSDIEKVTGAKPPLADRDADCSPCIVLQISDELSGEAEAYAVEITSKRITITGADDRALMFGIYHFSETYLGVDPLYHFSGLSPEQQPELFLPTTERYVREADFRFRGWFINDEDLLTEWQESGGDRDIDYRYYSTVVARESMAKVAEAAVRSGFNLIIPASFVDIDNPPERALVEEASRRGLYLSMHHIEPLGVSGYTYQNYWRERGEEPLFSYYSEPEKIEEVWRYYAGLWAEFPDVIWQLGLRGIADRPMWQADPGVPQSDAERAGIISDAMALQQRIVREVTGREELLMTTTLWGEGSYFNQLGLLNIPEGVITVFSDNNSGWHLQPDFYETEREAGRGYGVYYHHQLWGWGPHLAQAIPPWQTAKVMRDAYTTGVDDYVIMNVSNIREFLPGIAASADMLWDMEGFEGRAFLRRWCDERFGDAGETAYTAYATYFDGYALFGEMQMPGYLDGLSKIAGQASLRTLSKYIEEGYRAPELTAGTGGGAADPFGSAMGRANPKKQISRDGQLEGLLEQVTAFQRADSLTRLALDRLEGERYQLLHDNLLTHIGFQLAIGKWLVDLMRAEIAFEGGDREEAARLTASAADHLRATREIKRQASTGDFANWYRGDRKMNLPGMLEQTEVVIDLFAGKAH